MQSIGRFAYGVGFAVLGVLSLIYADFAMSWQPVPANLPHYKVLAIISGCILLLGGLGTVINRRPVPFLLTLFVFLWLLLLQFPRIVHQPGVEANWLSFGENLMNVVGGWMIIVGGSPGARRLGQILFGLALLPVGLAHLMYLDLTASMIPVWIPVHHLWAILTGIGHMAAGVAILIGMLPRLAAILEALMITAFVALLHIPGIAHAPSDRLQWTMTAIAVALAGSAWLVAGSFSSSAAPVRAPVKARA
ncbi:MAG TPA: DoxX family protein [Opitutaceae bacterium]|jgi:uncharacterized membrane protein